MIFTPPWFSKNHRLGFKACTPVGSVIVNVGDFLGMCAGVSFFIIPAPVIYQKLAHPTTWRFLLWLGFLLFLWFFTMGMIGRAIFEVGLLIARKKQFRYDYTSDTAWWNEAGVIKSFPPKTDLERSRN